MYRKSAVSVTVVEGLFKGAVRTTRLLNISMRFHGVLRRGSGCLTKCQVNSRKRLLR